MQFKELQSEQKLRGGYYTPLDLSVFISKWVTAPNTAKRFLEPSCGDGVFFEAIARVCKNRHIDISAFEIEKNEAAKARQLCNSFNNIKVKIETRDFLEWVLLKSENEPPFDGVVGNPPFIRYQYLSQQAQMFAEKIFSRYQLPFTKHTNAWVPFIVASIGLMKPGGRLGMVIPAEILHVMHAQSLRYFLSKNCKKLLIFDPEDLWFKDTLQGAVILLAEKKRESKEESLGLGIIRTIGKDFLTKNPDSYFKETNFINGKTVDGKWTRALLTQEELNLFENLGSHKRTFQFKEIADVDVGLVTGANSFFLVPDDVVKRYKLEQWSHPMFGRSEHCPGVIYDRKQHESNSKKGLPTNFLWFNVDNDRELSNIVKEYIEAGEKRDLHKRYKCRIRQPWYKVPSVYSSKIGMLKRAHDIPRLIYNSLGAYTTDTAYRITSSHVQPQKLAYYFINSLTALSAELEGRHYGGGVLELVPSEIERLVIPIPKNGNDKLKELDETFRHESVEEVLAIQDRQILGAIGVTKKEREIIHAGWNRLRKRRQRTSGESET